MSTFNHCYRLKWSTRAQSLQPVPETARRDGKSASAGQSRANAGSRVSGVLAVVALATIGTLTHAQQAPPAVNQLPTGGAVVRGSASISQTATANAASMTVNQASNRGVINWNTFNLGSNAQITFNQPGASSVTLNQVLSSDPSQIYGHITANGQVFFSNPSGIYFSPTASVDVGGLVATTHTMNADAFMAGQSTFQRNGASGSVVNEGTLQAGMGGYIALLAPEVRNAGVIVANAGTVALASGEAITLNFQGSNTLAGITTTASTIAALVENRQAVVAEGGQIILSANALSSLQGSVVKNSGSLRATSLTSKGGKIVLEGDSVTVASGSTLDASGATGGGTVLVGSDWEGQGSLRQATTVTMEAGASINASATGTGDGGTVVVRSDVSNASGVASVDGSITARGGALGGNGGQVETSGHALQVGALAVDIGAPQGQGGQWLLDPANITIGATSSGATNTGGTFSPNSGIATSNILASSVASALQSGDVVVTTTNTGTSGGSLGTIAINTAIAPVLGSGVTRNLTFLAGSTITIAANVDATTGGSAGAMNVLFETAGSITQNNGVAVNTNGGSAVYWSNNQSSTGAGGIAIGAYAGASASNYASIVTGGGNIVMGGGPGTTLPGGPAYGSGGGITVVNFAQVSAGAGNITFTGSGGSTATAGGILFGGSSQVTGNTVSMTGVGSTVSGGTQSMGIYLGGSIAASGNVNLTGTGGINSAASGGWGIEASGGSIVSTGGGITLNGTGYASSSQGLYAYSMTFSTSGGDINITGANAATSSKGITISGTGAMSSQAGNLHLWTDSFSSSGTIAVNGSGSFTVEPLSTGSIAGSYGLGGLSLASTLNGITLGGSNNAAAIFLSLPAATTIAGPITITGATVNLGSALATSDTSAGDITINGALSGAGNMTPAAGRGLYVQQPTGSSSSYAGIIGGSGLASFTGGGTLILTGASTYTGATTIGSGTTLQLGNGGAGSINGTSGITDNGLLSLNLTGNTVITPGISGSGALNASLTGGGTVLLNGSNSYTGNTTINAGTLKLGTSSTWGAGGTVSVTGGAVLDLNGQTVIPTNALTLNGTGISGGGALINSSSTGASYGGLLTLGSASSVVGGGGSITLSNTGTITGAGFGLTLGGAVGGTLDSVLGTGSGTLTKSGAGTWTLNGVNTYSGNTTINAGTLKLGTSSTWGAGGAVSVTGGAVLDLNGQTVIPTNALTLNGTGISGGGALINSSSTGASYGGLLTLGSASSVVGGGGSITLSNTGTITGAGSGLTLGGAVGGTLDSILGTGSSTLTKTGAGIWTLNGSNTYTSVTTVSAGILQLGNAAALGTSISSVTVASGAALDLNGQSVAGAKSLTINATGVSGGGALMNSSSTAATWSGLLTLGSASSVVGEAGSITLGNTGTITGSGFGLTLGGAIGGILDSKLGTAAGSLTKQGAGNWALSGASTYTGGTTINGGTLTIYADTNLGAVPGAASTNITLNGGTLALNNTSGILALSANRNIVTGSNGGTISYTSGLYALTLSNSISGTGAFTLNAGGNATVNANTATPSGTINVQGAVTLNGGDLTLASNINSNGNAILVKSSGNITQNASVVVNSGGGAVTYWADSDATGGGAIVLTAGTVSNLTSINSAGGAITLGGDTGTSTPTGAAIGTTGINLGANSLLQAGSGAIVVTGQSNRSVVGGIGVSVGNGSVINGATISLNGTGSANASSSSGMSLGAAQIVASGLVTLTGTGGAGGSGDGVVLNATTVGSSGNGSVTISGTGGSGSGGSNRGIVINGTSGGSGSTVYSNSGALQLTGTGGGGGLAGGSYGIVSTYANTIGATGQTSTTLNANGWSWDATGVTSFLGSGPVTLAPLTGSSVLGNVGGALSFASTITGLTIGADGNTGSVTLSRNNNVAGPISIYGDAINIAGTLTSTGSGANGLVTLKGSSNITDTGLLTASGLLLQGSGSTTTSVNGAVGTVSGSGLGNVVIANTGALTVGSLGGVQGLSSSGTVSVSTASGDLTLNNSVTTSNTTSSAVLLDAGTATAALTSTGGNIVVGNGATVSVGSGGRATLYTGSVAGSTGLGALVGSGSGHFRYASNLTTTGYNIGAAALGTGLYAIYREQPVVTWGNAANQTITYGQRPVMDTTTAVTGFVNGDTASQSFSVLNQITGLGAALNTSGYYNAGNYVLSKTAGAQALGYAATNPTLTVQQATLTVTAADASKTYNAAPYSGGTGVTYAGFATGESTAQLGGAISYSGTSQGAVNAGTYAITPGGRSSNNYSFNYVNGTLTVNAAPLIVQVNNDARFVTQSDATLYNGVSYSGFVGGQSASVLGGTLAIARTGGDTLPGSYTGVLTGSGLASNNYQISYRAGNYTIVPANQLLVKVTNTQDTYGAAPVYAVTSAQYLNSNNTIVDLTSSITFNGSALSLSDGAGGLTAFTLGPKSAVLSGAGLTAVGAYQLGASSINSTSANYSNNLVVTGSLQVNPKAVSATLGAGPSKTYDGTNALSVAALDFTGLVQGDVATIGGSAAYATANAGTNIGYTVANLALSGHDAGNYVLSAGNTISANNGTINQAPLTITASNFVKNYDQVAYSGGNGVTYSGLVNNQDASVLTGTLGYAGSAQGAINVGNYSITPQGLSSSNYAITYVNGNLAVTPAPVTITAINGSLTGTVSKVYDGSISAYLTGGNFLLTGWLGSDGAVVSGVYGSYDNANAGTGKTVTVALFASDYSGTGSTNLANYTLPTSLSGAVGIITPAPLTVTGSTVAAKNYNGSTTAVISGGVLQGLIGSDAFTLNQAGSFSSAHVYLVNGTPAPVAVTASDSIAATGNGLTGNYTLVQPTGLSAVITPAALTVTGTTVAGKTYDGGTTASVGSGVLQGLVGNDAFTLTQSGSFVSPHVNLVNGTAAPVAVTASDSLAAQGNTQVNDYTFTQPTGLSAVITPAALTVTGSTVAGKTYDGGTIASVGSGVLQGLVGNDAFTLTQSGSFVSPHVNLVNGIAAPVAVTASDNIAAQGNTQVNDYTFTQPTGLSAVITPAALTVTGTAVAGKTYDGGTTASVGSGVLQGLVGNDAFTLTQSGSFVSPHVNLVNGTAASVAVTASDSLAAQGNTQVNDYTFTQPTGLSAVITQAPLTAALSNSSVTKVYDGTSNAPAGFAPALAVTGMVTGDTAASVSIGSAAFNSANVSGANSFSVNGLAVQAITGSLGSLASDYALTSSSATTSSNVSITPAPLTMAANDSAKFITQADPTGYAGVRYSGFVNNENSNVLNASALQFVRSDASNNNAGSYTLSASGVTANNGNYSITAQAGSFSILGANQLLLQVAPTSAVYGSGAGAYALSSAQYLNGANVIVTIPANQISVSNGVATVSDGVGGVAMVALAPRNANYSSSGNLNAGAYEIGAGSVTTSNAQNFSNTVNVLGVETVTAAQVTPSASGVSKVYDGTTAMTGLSMNLTGTLPHDQVTVSGLGNFSDANAGNGKSYSLSGLALSGSDAGNYYLGNTNTLSGNNGQITPALLAVTGTTVAGKTYDGTTAATLNAGVLQGLVGGDSFTLTQSGNFVSPHVNLVNGSAAPVAVTANDSITPVGSTLASNYTFTQPTGLSAVITPAALTVTGTTVAGKTYDGGTTASVGSGVLQGLVGNDAFTLSQSGSFVSPHVNLVNGTAAPVAVTASDSLAAQGNTQVNDYTFTQPSGLTAAITQAPLNINAVTASKIYDGQTSATGAVPQVGALAGSGVGNALASAPTEAFSDANVGTGKTLTANPVTVLDANGNDITSNYQISYVPSHSGSINQLSSVTWVGANSGNWFNPANWAGGAVPDLSNVANVVLPVGVTVTFSAASAPAALASAAAQPVNLSSLGNAGQLNMTDGSLQVGTGGMALAGLSQSGGTISSAGPVQLSNFAQTGGSMTTAAAVTDNGNFTQSANGTLSVGGDLAVQTHTAVVLGNLAVGGNLSVQTDNAAISQVAAISVNGTSNLNVGNATVQLPQANNHLVGPVTVNAASSNIVGGQVTGGHASTAQPPTVVVLPPTPAPAAPAAPADGPGMVSADAGGGSASPAKAAQTTNTDKPRDVVEDYVLKVARLPSNLQSGLIDVALNSAVMAVNVALPPALTQNLQAFEDTAALTGLGGAPLPDGIVYSPGTNAVSITDASGLKFPVILVLRQGKVRSVVQITRNKNTSS